MKTREVFTLYKRYWTALEYLSDDQFGRLIRALFRYELGEEQQIDDDIIVIFELIRINLDADEGENTDNTSKHYNSPASDIIMTNYNDYNINNNLNNINNIKSREKLKREKIKREKDKREASVLSDEITAGLPPDVQTLQSERGQHDPWFAGDSSPHMDEG